jgi:hypothetical protein
MNPSMPLRYWWLCIFRTVVRLSRRRPACDLQARWQMAS